MVSISGMARASSVQGKGGREGERLDRLEGRTVVGRQGKRGRGRRNERGKSRRTG